MKLQLPHKYKNYLVYFLITFLIVLSAYNFYFINKILPGVYVNDVNFGGLDSKAAIAKMDDIIPKSKLITVTIDSKPYDIPFTDIDLTYNKQATFDKLFNIGRENYFSQLSYIPGFLIKKSNIDFDYSFSENQLDVELATMSAQIYPKVKNAYFTYSNDTLTINEAGRGKIVNLVDLKIDIKNNLKYSKTAYTAKTQDFIPTIYKKDLESMQNKMGDYVKNGIKLVYKDDSYSPSKEALVSFVEFDKSGDTIGAHINTFNVSNYVIEISSKVDQEPKSIDFKIKDNGEIDEFNAPKNGRNLEKTETEKQISETISNYFNNDKELKEISLNVKEITPDANSNKYGITQLVAEGISYFEHSIAGRVSNIKTASEKINGTLVAPGEFYSFNDSVGPIDLASGFNSAYVISKGRTILGTGGGVCQVSSTVFRAALNGGFPITERTAHAYRVGYYEQHSKIGYDATIYQPSVDLKFKNDTEHYLLVTTELNLDKMKLSVKIYGTGDGRIVEVTDPVLGKQIAPPKDIYEDDPSLPKGQVVQTEFPAWGGSSVFKQIVKNKDGTLKFENTFKSNYQPWPAVFKKGTKS